ncbi:MAG: 3-oxoacyl-acyl-carrier-protein synthase III [bacterium]|nr:MAG: 3-oxoacyl-acyl-carrier-protein synthase III [bacterium]
MLFGDGAGAVIVSNNLRLSNYTSNPVLELKDLIIATDGAFAEDLSVKAPGTANGKDWLNDEQMELGLHYGSMNGRVVIMHAVRKLGDVANEILKRNSLSLDQISLLVPHQANANLLKSLAKRMSFPEEKIVVNLDRLGNTSSASAFLALCQAKEESRFIPGQYVMILAFGAGFTWGAALCQVFVS